jgi:hypothetical protein
LFDSQLTDSELADMETVLQSKVAIDMEDGAYNYIYQAKFNRNYKHIRITDPVGTPSFAVQRIRQSQFLCQNSVTDPTYTNLLPPRQNEYTWTQIEAQNVRGLLVGSSGNGNTFSNAVFGVVASGVKDVEVLYNDFDDVGWFGTWAAYAPNVSGTQIDISYNTYDRSLYPIYCYDNDVQARTHITNNTISFAGMAGPPDFMTGITVEEITPAPGTGGNYNFVDVSHNNIYNAPCGINLRNMLGNRTSPTADLYVGDNTITHIKNNSNWQAGIKTDFVTEIAISNNTISHPTGNTNWWETSIRVSGGSRNSVTCNYLSNHGRAIITDNDIRPSSHFYENEMTGHDDGFFMNYSIIGAQGTVAEPYDNQWLGSWSWKSHIECYGSSSYGPDSPFTVRSTGSTYYPVNLNGTNGGTPVPTPTTTSNTWPNGCNYSGPSFKTDGGGENTAASVALGIIQGQENAVSEVDEAMNWNARFNLFRQLQNDDELVFADEAIAAFNAQQNTGNIGRLYRAMSAFNNPAPNGQGSITQALATIQSLNPQNRPEQTLKRVLKVLLANTTDLAGMGSESEAVLREMAQRCPIDDGFGVYMARAALLKIDTLPKNYVSDCEMVQPSEEISNKWDETETTFTAYPNPSNGSFVVGYAMDETETGDVTVYDMLGNRVFQQSLSSESLEAQISLADVASGIYLLKIEVGGNTQLSERITVLRP